MLSVVREGGRAIVVAVFGKEFLNAAANAGLLRTSYSKYFATVLFMVCAITIWSTYNFRDNRLNLH